MNAESAGGWSNVEAWREVRTKMADPNAPITTAAIAPGNTTSEYQLTRIVMAIGLALQVAGAVVATLPQGNPWVGVAMIAIGSIKQALSLFGYQQARATVKAAALGSES